jgi:hypothetical protein
MTNERQGLVTIIARNDPIPYAKNGNNELYPINFKTLRSKAKVQIC